MNSLTTCRLKLVTIQRNILSHPLRRHPNWRAVALAEQSAALAPFQRHQPSLPLHKIVNSAVSRLLPACHFSD